MKPKTGSIKSNLLVLVLLTFSVFSANSSERIYDVFDYDAKGDGKTLDTKAIQSAIDICHNKGGGKVYLHMGCFVSGTIYLKDNVTLEIEAGATLRASNNLNDFPITTSNYPSYEGTFVTNKMLIYAEDAKNISITGRGTIDGNGDHWVDGPYGTPTASIRPRIIHFRGCENVLIRDVTLYNSASWVQSYQSCKNMVIDGITVDSRPNKDIEKERFADARGRNTDGLDLIDCQQVRISNAFINSGDDALCMKSFSPDKVTRDITISNCIMSSNASGIKIGTESAGAFEDITIQNCVVYDTRADAIALLTADGARIERIIVSNISMRNIKGAAIGVRLGARNRIYRESAKINEPALKDILIENIQGSGILTDYGCVITGIKSRHLENIIFKNINLQFEGGGKIEDSYRVISEKDEAYPSGRMFGKMPSYGFFIRHAKNVTLENIALRFDKEEQRPAILCDHVEQLEIRGLRAAGTKNTPELIRLVNTRDVIVLESRPTSSVPVFLSVFGESDDIVLMNNFLKNAKQNFTIENESMKLIIKEIGTVE